VAADIGDAQEPGSNVDGTKFITQVFTLCLPAQVIGRSTTSLLLLYSLLHQPRTSGLWNSECRICVMHI